jgi:predicted Zn finger-like uncharacterized protein
VRIACPACSTTLAVADELAGRRIKCPGCRHVFEVSGVPAEAIAPGAKTAPPVAPSAPRTDQRVTEASRLPVRETDRDAYQGRRCYINIDGDDVKLIPAIQRRFERLIATEELDLEIMNEYVKPPDDLGPADVVIYGTVTECDYGSQFVRYFLTFIAMLGPGACKLDVEAQVETVEGTRRIGTKSRRWAGLFGGSGTELMKQNVGAVATHIARGAARFITGYSFLNIQVYSCANWSLGLGCVSVLPYIGVPFGLVGLVLGMIALLTINARGLPRGRNMAITGLLLPFLGFVATAGLIVLSTRR